MASIDAITTALQYYLPDVPSLHRPESVSNMYHNGDAFDNDTGGFEENSGRHGPSLTGSYMFPAGDEEKDLLDLLNSIMLQARGEYISVDLPPQPRILDVGTGTGWWAINVSDRFWKGPLNHASVDGLDISLIQPRTIPESVSFIQANIEKPWPRLPHYDLVHIQLLFGSIRDWKGIYKQAFSCLQPGGHLEQAEVDWKFVSDDGTLKPSSSLVTWSDTLHRALRTAGMPLDVDRQTRNMLQEIGFVAVTETVIKLPINPWGSQESEKELGKCFNAALSQAAHSMSIAPLTRSERWSKDDILKLVDDVRQEACTLSTHGYCKLPFLH